MIFIPSLGFLAGMGWCSQSCKPRSLSSEPRNLLSEPRCVSSKPRSFPLNLEIYPLNHGFKFNSSIF